MNDSMAGGRAPSWYEVHSYAERLFAPGFGRALSAAHPSLHPARDLVAATVEVRNSLEGRPTSHVALFRDGDIELVRPGHRPTWSPDGGRLAHLADGGVRLDEVVIPLPGTPERLAWSPDGSQLLVVMAEPGSEIANVDGSGLLTHPHDADSWLPHLSLSDRHFAWRRLVVIDVATLHRSVVGRSDLNVWDACWAGGDGVLAVCSDGSPTESAWFRADLRRIDVRSGADTTLVEPATQLGSISAAPSGRRAVYVEAICSDRDMTAGNLHLVDLTTGETRSLAVPADVTHLQFIDEQQIGFAGIRGLTTVVGTVRTSGQLDVVWQSEHETILGIGPHASFLPERTAFVRGAHKTPPEMCLVHQDDVTVVASMAHPGSKVITEESWTSEVRHWTAPDGLEIEGWLHLPDRPGPYPLVVWLHGGPVGSHRSHWSAPNFLMPYLLSQGYVVFQPNPRGSCGRGQPFASAVVGDPGGADAHDIRTGVADLVGAGLVDPDRVGVMGGSYGGFMTAWLVTQCDTFAAAVSMYPITDWTYQHGMSNIPYFDELFLDGQPYAKDGLYRQRSPLEHAHHVRTPTLFVAGERDRACPPGQALAMHRALVAVDVPSDCAVYPQEAHGARDMSAIIDVAARVTDWFARWMPPRGANRLQQATVAARGT